MNLSRRAFLSACLTATAAPSRAWPGATTIARPSSSAPAPSEFPWGDVGGVLRSRYRDLRRHFVFEYYPWYANDPFRHWQQWGREPPTDLAANTVPLLGAYDSRSTAVIAQHARWIAESGVGVVNLSWWRPESFSDQAVHAVMDVMRDHDIQVTFHLEPYGPERVDLLSADIRYLLTEYGDKRRWDCFFLHERADGSRGPVFKIFATTLPEQITDCRGVLQDVPLYMPDTRWSRAIDQVREDQLGQFDRVTLLTDTWDAGRAKQAGLDGIAVYDPAVEPETWLDHALTASRLGLTFSFSANPGLDEIDRRKVLPDSCYSPRPFLPTMAEIDWTREDHVADAHVLSAARIRQTLEWSLYLQTHPWLGNLDAGFFLVYLTSFNEWHEGHQFEPMKDRALLSADERALGYHNPEDGAYRLRLVAELLSRL